MGSHNRLKLMLIGIIASGVQIKKSLFISINVISISMAGSNFCWSFLTFSLYDYNDEPFLFISKIIIMLGHHLILLMGLAYHLCTPKKSMIVLNKI